MNFQIHFESLQNEKPVFVFSQFDNQDIIKVRFKELDDYMNTNIENSAIRRQIFNATATFTHSCYKSKMSFYQDDQSNFE